MSPGRLSALTRSAASLGPRACVRLSPGKALGAKLFSPGKEVDTKDRPLNKQGALVTIRSENIFFWLEIITCLNTHPERGNFTERDQNEEGDLTFWCLLIDHLFKLIFPSFFSSAEHVKSPQVLLCQVIKDALMWRAVWVNGIRASLGGPSVLSLPEGIGARIWRKLAQ